MPIPAYSVATTTIVNQTVDDYLEIEREARARLEWFATNRKYSDVTIVPRLLTNGLGLIHAVTDQPANLIVMTSEGASGLEEWLLGSNAESIVRYAHCPVLILKAPIAHFRPENIVYAIDLDDRLKAVQHYPFQMGEQEQHQFLYVLTPTDSRVPEGIRDWINELADSTGITHSISAIRKASNVPKGIIDYADEVKADLIVLFTHGYKGLRHFLSGSVTDDVLNHTTKPVLVMRL